VGATRKEFAACSACSAFIATERWWSWLRTEGEGRRRLRVGDRGQPPVLRDGDFADALINQGVSLPEGRTGVLPFLEHLRTIGDRTRRLEHLRRTPRWVQDVVSQVQATFAYTPAQWSRRRRHIAESVAASILRLETPVVRRLLRNPTQVEQSKATGWWRVRA